MRAMLTCALVVAVAAGAAVQAAKYTSIWKAPDAGTIGFLGKKVAALVIAKDQALRMSAEESLARQLEAIGVHGVAAYRLIPREELQDKEKAKAWFEQSDVQGVVAMRLVDAKTITSRSPMIWSSGYYQGWWSYYDYGWGAAWASENVREDTTLTIEALVFSVPRDKLLWAALGETTNPKSMDAFMKDAVSSAVKEMKKAGLTARSK